MVVGRERYGLHDAAKHWPSSYPFAIGIALQTGGKELSFTVDCYGGSSNA